MVALDGRSIFLRSLDDSDVTQRYLEWFGDSDVTKFLELQIVPEDLDDLKRFVAECNDDPSVELFGIFLRDSRLHIGNVKLGPRSFLHRSSALGILIGDKSCWNRGLASEAIALASDWAFGSLFCEKLTAGCISDNLGSIKAFRKASFEIEGIQRQQVKRRDSEKRGDVVLLGRTYDRS